MSFQRDSGQFRQGNPVYQKFKDFVGRMKKLSEASNEELITYAEEIGKDLSNTIDITQLRKVLDAFQRIQSKIKVSKRLPLEGKGIETNVNVREEVQPLKIYISYAAGRAEKRPIREAFKNLQGVIVAALDKVEDEEDFQKLSYLIEGFVAYHEFYKSPKKGGD